MMSLDVLVLESMDQERHQEIHFSSESLSSVDNDPFICNGNFKFSNITLFSETHAFYLILTILRALARADELIKL